MIDRLVMFSGVFVFRRIATSDVSTRQTQSQMDPGIAGLDTVFTEMLVRRRELDFIKMCTERRGL
jgi:hypothetical protein